MKWYWTLQSDNLVANPFVADSEFLNGCDEWTFLQGKKLSDWDTNAWFQAESPENDGDPDDVLQNAAGIPVYSSRLRKTLQTATIGGIQYLPVNVLRQERLSIKGYTIANILNRVSALDLDRSDYDLFGEDMPSKRGQIAGLRLPVLRANALRDYHVIRLTEFPFYIFVSDYFRTLFEKHSFTGYSFRPIEVL